MTLAYDTAYHLRCRLVLASGRQVTLKALHQRMTYAGLLEGLPDSESNDLRIEGALSAARAQCVERARPYLIPPTRRDHLRKPGDMASGPLRQPAEWLPPVTCIGEFETTASASGAKEGVSSVLTVVWFQDEFALPILEPALSALIDLDWSILASDVAW